MSLVNLAHVCSHLQNASLARLGLTSIPYTKLHLSLALLLQKQGFFSSVKLGGPSPPASCFGNGQPDNHHISNHIHPGQLDSGETALAYKVHKKAGITELRRMGFRKEAIEFAEQHGNRSREEMIEMGALDGARRMALSARSELERYLDEAVEEECLRERIDASEKGRSLETAREAEEARKKWISSDGSNVAHDTMISADGLGQEMINDEAPEDQYSTEETSFDDEAAAAPHSSEQTSLKFFRQYAKQYSEPHSAEIFLNPRQRQILFEFREARLARLTRDFMTRKSGVLQTLLAETRGSESEVLSHEYSQSSLAEFLGPKASILSASRIEREGITLEAMGQVFPNQPIALPREEYLDMDGLEAEGVVTPANRASRRLWLGLKYHESMPVLTKAQLVSKPTKRIWLSSRELSRVIRGNQAGEVKGMRQIGEVLAVSTDRGIMEARDCVDRQIGGQALVRVW